MSRGKFPRDTRNPCSFCAVAIFVNLGTDLHDQPLQALDTKANLSRHIIILNRNKAYRCHFNKKVQIFSNKFQLQFRGNLMIYFNYGLLFNIWTCDQKNRFLCRHIIGRCLQLCCCATHESLQALRHSLQAVTCSLQAHRANLYVCLLYTSDAADE